MSETSARQGTDVDIEADGHHGRSGDRPDWLVKSNAKFHQERAKQATTDERRNTWKARWFAVSSLEGVPARWARDLAWKYATKDAFRDPITTPPTLFFNGADAVEAGASDEQLASLPRLQPAEMATLKLRAAAIRQNCRKQVDTLARRMAEGTDEGDGPLYADLGQLLDDGVPDPPTPDILRRTDGVGLFYRSEINLLYGDPEDGKTMIALAACAERLRDGGTALFVDLDDNGKESTVARLLMLGAPESALRDQKSFRYCAPASRDRLAEVITDNTTDDRVPDLAIFDCVGELVPLFDGSNNDSDDFTRIIRATAGPLARTGAGVILIDHMAKNTDSRRYGAGGTMAKRRRVGGTQLRVVVEAPLRKGQGGALRLLIRKDRHSGLRQHCHPAPDTEGALQEAGRFIIDPGDTAWCVSADPMVVGVRTGSAIKCSTYANAARLLDDGWTIAALAKRVHGEEPTEAQRKATGRAVKSMINAAPPLVEKLTEGAKYKPATYRLIATEDDSADEC